MAKILIKFPSKKQLDTAVQLVKNTPYHDYKQVVMDGFEEYFERLYPKSFTEKKRIAFRKACNE